MAAASLVLGLIGVGSAAAKRAKPKPTVYRTAITLTTIAVPYNEFVEGIAFTGVVKSPKPICRANRPVLVVAVSPPYTDEAPTSTTRAVSDAAGHWQSKAFLGIMPGVRVTAQVKRKALGNRRFCAAAESAPLNQAG